MLLLFILLASSSAMSTKVLHWLSDVSVNVSSSNQGTHLLILRSIDDGSTP
jgi:hypothetical protein